MLPEVTARKSKRERQPNHRNADHLQEVDWTLNEIGANFCRNHPQTFPPYLQVGLDSLLPCGRSPCQKSAQPVDGG